MHTDIAEQTEKTSWLESCKIYLQKRVAILFFLGFSAGLPILLVFSTLSFWLREAGVSRASIGFFSWIALAYAFKWIWSPFVDRLSIPLLTQWLGRRRSWLLMSQISITLAIIGMAMSDPQQNLVWFAVCALVVAYSSATQDIVIDAFRIESAPEQYQAAMAAAYMTGYRLAMIMAGAGSLAIAAWASESEAYQLSAWSLSYFVMAACMAVGIITTFVAKEPEQNPEKQQALQQRQDAIEAKLKQSQLPRVLARFIAWLNIAVLAPFTDFFNRYGKHALLILVLIGSYRISDIVMGIMANPFYVDMGYTKGEVAAISKVFGVIMTLLGAGLGGILLNRYSTYNILFLGALLVVITNLIFAILAFVGKDLTLLTLIISMDNISAGIATTAFITYISKLTNIEFSATQYALFSSMMLLFPKFIAGFSGVYVDSFGYVNFFIASALIGLPVLALIILLKKIIEA
ncbi:MFS transporter [Psychromonas sp. 14N.309.X.WAT.B.A12]|uniref:AmpG family muropeptide MFS transporter n=1 Tax=Psychromonas sp. 14N.309.X.WAT.B.A12 TaxID=2998322 RepID=UPI0025AF2CD9|nr:MFS transporter [Psychromonas sp. 14N.309.X.WAT.B.A12]MDN2661781.1 MFS transporter [Psychromonas sp. 14N.309.X.WAT.B.A12]